MSTLSNWGPVVVIVLGYVIGFYFQNRRIDDLRDAINQRFAAVDARLSDLNSKMDSRFADLKDFVRSEISRLEDRIERLEHPVVKP
jgi:archaellum component FlaC